MSEQNQYSELECLIESLATGTLDETADARLEELVATDLAARRLYLERVFLIGQLHWRFGESKTLDAALPALVEGSPAKVSSPLLGFLSGVARNVAGSVYASTLLVAIVCYGAFTFLAWNLRSEKLPTDGDNTVVGIVSNSTSAGWSPEAAVKTSNSPIRPGETFEIETGSIELRLHRGVHLVVAGPAKWSIDGVNRATLHRGRLVGNVSHEAIGFTLETPTTRIVDLGTQFGVATDERGTTEVQVFDGQVEVQPLAAPVDAQPMRLGVGNRAVVFDDERPPAIHTSSTEADLQRFAWAESSMSGITRQRKSAKQSTAQSITPFVTQNGGTTRTDTYPQAGFGFCADASGTVEINRLGYWDEGSDGLRVAHAVALYHFNGKNSTMIAQATVPAGKNATLASGYRWASIPTIKLSDTRQSADYYQLVATHGGDTWYDGGITPVTAAMGTITGHGFHLNAPMGNVGDTVTFNVYTTYGGANMGYAAPQRHP